MFLNISEHSHENTCDVVTNEDTGTSPDCHLLKIPAQAFSYGFYRIFKNRFFNEHFQAILKAYKFAKCCQFCEVF